MNLNSQADRCPLAAAEQVNWIADHLREMCDLAPPGFLHITIFITSKRKSGETAVLPGYVTIDKRDPVEGEEKSQRDGNHSSGRDIDAQDEPETLRNNGSDQTRTAPDHPRTERSGSESTLNDEMAAEDIAAHHRDKPVRIIDATTRAKAENVTHASMVELRSGRPNFPELIDRELKATDYAE